MKNIFNPSAILYTVLLVAIVLIIGFASNNNPSTKLRASQIKIMKEKTTTIVLETNLGNIEIALLADKAPQTAANFLKIANSGFYDNTKFHRVIKGFMIQGGDPYSKGEDKSVYGTGGPGYAFDDEQNDLPMVRGMVAMANSGPNTNGSQFFIVTAASTPWLVGKHTIFGQVIVGMDVVDKIENLKVDGRDLPLTPAIVQKVTVK
jgi:cyclophilin family peptidyl-prolyl cis-trans isomerase